MHRGMHCVWDGDLQSLSQRHIPPSITGPLQVVLKRVTTSVTSVTSHAVKGCDAHHEEHPEIRFYETGTWICTSVPET